MPRDHYVAQTYLRHFTDPGGELHVYRKSDGQYQRSGPKGVCYESDGDLIRDFLKNERLLGDYRAIFEPSWNDAIANVGNGVCNAAVKMAIAGYCANLMVCTPAWTRVGVKARSHNAMRMVKTRDVLSTEAGKPDAKLKEMIAALESGQYRLEAEPEAIRARAAVALAKFAWTLYNADWTMIRNRTSAEFITSDNPVAFDDPGPWRPTRKPGLPRYLPLTPRLCLYAFMNPRGERDEPDFTQAPRGQIQWGSVPLHGVQRINRVVAQCAEEIVISSKEDTSVQSLAAEYAGYRVDMEFITIRQRDGFIHGNHTRVRKQPEAAGDEGKTSAGADPA